MIMLRRILDGKDNRHGGIEAAALARIEREPVVSCNDVMIPSRQAAHAAVGVSDGSAQFVPPVVGLHFEEDRHAGSGTSLGRIKHVGGDQAHEMRSLFKRMCV